MTDITSNIDNDNTNMKESDINIDTEEYIKNIIYDNESFKLLKIEDNGIKLSYNNKSFLIKIERVEDYNSSYILEYTDKSLDSLKIINDLIKIKNFTICNLLKKIMEVLSKIKINTEFSDIDDKNFSKAFKIVSEFDLIMEKDIDNIRKNIDNSVSPLSLLDKNYKDNYNEQLKKDVSELLLKKYRDVKNYFKDSSRYSISSYNNNIYRWRIKMRNFTSNSISSIIEYVDDVFHYDYIEIELIFHDILYPIFPILINCIRPKLENSFVHKLANIKYVNIDYWNVKTDIKKLITKTYNIINNYADINEIEETNNIKNYPESSYIGIENDLITLSSLSPHVNNDDEFIEDNNLKDIICDNMENDKLFDENSTLIINRPQKDTLHTILNNILNSIKNIKKDNKIFTYRSINESYLITFLIKILDNSIEDMCDNKDIMETIFKIIKNLSYGDGIYMLCDKKTEEGLLTKLLDFNKKIKNKEKNFVYGSLLYDNYKSLNKIIKETVEKVKYNYDNLVKDVALNIRTNNIYIKLHPFKILYEKKLSSHSVIETNIRYNNFSDFEESFKNDTNKIHNIYMYFYNNKNKDKDLLCNINKEIKKIYNENLINYNSSIFFAYDSENIQTLRMMLTGPCNTPYESGIFIFDILCKNDYPYSAPLVKLVNINKKINCDINCNGTLNIPILKNWDYKIHNLKELVIQIRETFILEENYNFLNINKKYKNNTNIIDDDKKKILKEKALIHIRLMIIKYNINYMLEFPDKYKGFSKIIKYHFKIKKNDILKSCGKWVDITPNDNKLKLKLKDEFNKLKNYLKNLN